ncbi:hypothetical protein F2Q69_00036241 [Brassica cretica]|uniref:Uncharacterized protein n=1 Tax=Brassica cretica TaxID=69181 RepID=A0A8S9SEL7_BRACR|nr:hypothetical protein F2Q69_00036241 [Brassica cretica]
MSKLTEASASPSPSNPTSLRETYVGYKTGKQILSSTEIQDQGPKSYKITFEQVHNLDVLIKTPVYHLEKPLSSRTLVFIHQHEEVPTPTPTTKLRLRPLLLSLTPEFVQGATIKMGMRLKAGIGLINLSMLVKTTYNPESSMQHGNSIVTSFRTVECEIPTGLEKVNLQVLYNPRAQPRPQGLEELLGSQLTSVSLNDLRVLNTTSWSRGTSGFPIDLRVPKRPQVPKYDLRV